MSAIQNNLTPKTNKNSKPLRIIFVCTGNICRSPMGEKILLKILTQTTYANRVKVSSAGTGNWHEGHSADSRTVTVLQEKNYPSDHIAHSLTSTDLTADLLIALDTGHKSELLKLGAKPNQVRLLKNFDPNATTKSVADPYYGNLEDFRSVRQQIEAAIPGILTWIENALASN